MALAADPALVGSNWFATVTAHRQQGFWRDRAAFERSGSPAATSYTRDLQARKSGELFVYVNDSVIGIPGYVDTFYRTQGHGGCDAAGDRRIGWLRARLAEHALEDRVDVSGKRNWLPISAPLRYVLGGTLEFVKKPASFASFRCGVSAYGIARYRSHHRKSLMFFSRIVFEGRTRTHAFHERPHEPGQTVPWW